MLLQRFGPLFFLGSFGNDLCDDTGSSDVFGLAMDFFMKVGEALFFDSE